MLKKFLSCLLCVVFIISMVNLNVFAADTDDEFNKSLMEFVSDLHSSNVRYNVYNEVGQDVTASFNIATVEMSNKEICDYLHENVLMVSKYYISDIQLASVGGNDTFVKLYQGYVWDRNHYYSTSIYFELRCNVTWDSENGIYNGSCYMIPGTIFSETYYMSGPCTMESENYSTKITNNNRKITYTYEMVFSLYVPTSSNKIYYDLPEYIFSWSC